MNALTELELRADTEARHAHQELVEELEAKLAKAVEAVRDMPILATYDDHLNWKRTTLAELKGETDD